MKWNFGILLSTRTRETLFIYKYGERIFIKISFQRGNNLLHYELIYKIIKPRLQFLNFLNPSLQLLSLHSQNIFKINIQQQSNMLSQIPEQPQPQQTLQKHLTLLTTQYNKMNLLQLKKQRMKSIQDLKQIHQLLNQLIEDQQMQLNNQGNNLQFVRKSEYSILQFERQIRYMERKKNGLERSLENFQFMLTHQYDDKVNQQINEGKGKLKILKYEVNLLKRQMEIPMEKQLEFCQKLQKEAYLLQQQIEQIKSKNRSKSHKITLVSQQNQHKLKKLSQATNLNLKSKNKQIQLNQIQQQTEYREKARNLQEQRIKLIKLIDTAHKSYGVKYKKIKKEKMELQKLSGEVDGYIQAIDQEIEKTNQDIKLNKLELKRTKQKNKQIKQIKPYVKKNSTAVNNSARKRYHTQTYQPKNQSTHKSTKLIQQEQPSKYIIPHRQSESHIQPKKPQSYLFHQNPKSHKFPDIYQFIGKKRLLVEDECDLSELVYQGEDL